MCVVSSHFQDSGFLGSVFSLPLWPVLDFTSLSRASAKASSSSYSVSNFPSASLGGDLFHFTSGNPEGDNTMLMMSLMREVFMTRSLGVVWDKEGEAFTSISQGFRLVSMMMSYP